MAIENTYLLGKNITLGCGFDLQAKAPLDSRQTVPSTAGLQALIDGNAAYEGMIVYDEESKKTYQAQIVDDVLTFREFGINEAELKDLIASETTAAMEFKGAATALPENPAKGDMYKVTASFKVGEEDVKVGDSIVYDGEQWFIIPSGDDIEDTWRPVTGVDNDATLTFVAGDKLEKTVAADGTITYKHVAIDAPEDMTAEDDENTRTYITQLTTDNHGHIIGFKTATENVEDTNTTYEFEGLPVGEDEVAPSSVYFQVKSSDAEAAEVIYLDAYNKNEANAELAKKVDKVEGYSLVSDTEIARLAKVDNYDDEEVRGLIGDNTKAIEDLADYVGTVPTDDKYKDLSVVAYINKKAEETLAAAQGGSSETAASVKQQLDNYKSANDTRVKAVEDKADGLDAAIGSVSEQITQLEGSVALTYLSKEEAAKTYETIERVNGLETTFINSVNAVVGTDTDDASKDTVKGAKKYADKAIEDANLSQYAKSSDLAAETKARTDADTDFETRIVALEGNFGDGEGTVEAQIAAAVKAEEDARKLAVKGVQDEVDALETESAKHALKTELEAVDAKFADYTKTSELPTDLGDFTNNVGYAKTAEVSTELDKKADKTQVETDIANAVAPLATTEALNGVKATAEAARTEDEVNSQIDAKITALNLGTTYEPIGAEDRAKAYVDGKFTDANLGQYTTEQEVKDIVDGVIAGAVDGDTITGLANLVEYLNTHGTEAKEMGAAIDVLEGDVKGLKEAPSAGIKATDIEAWNGEIGAKALAKSKTTTAEVKDQIESYGYATEGYADDKASDAQAAAEAKAAELDAALKTELQGSIATAKSEAIAEASNQDVVVLAESQAFAEGKVTELAEGAVATNAGNIETLFQMFQWGSF